MSLGAVQPDSRGSRTFAHAQSCSLHSTRKKPMAARSHSHNQWRPSWRNRSKQCSPAPPGRIWATIAAMWAATACPVSGSPAIAGDWPGPAAGEGCAGLAAAGGGGGGSLRHRQAQVVVPKKHRVAQSGLQRIARTHGPQPTKCHAGCSPALANPTRAEHRCSLECGLLESIQRGLGQLVEVGVLDAVLQQTQGMELVDSLGCHSKDQLRLCKRTYY